MSELPNAEQQQQQQQQQQEDETQTPTPSPSTSTQSSNTASFSNWFGSMIQTAKQKSSEAYELVKRDLNELVETVETDTAFIVDTANYVKYSITDTIQDIGNALSNAYIEKQSTGTNTDEEVIADHLPNTGDNDISGDTNIVEGNTNLGEIAKQKLSSLVNRITDAFMITGNDWDEDMANTDAYVYTDGELVSINRWKASLNAIQLDPNTYCREPDGPPEDYEIWLTSFNLINYQNQMALLLDSVPQMRQFYDQLVPNSLSDVDFWHRYYYKVHQLRKKFEKSDNDSPTNNCSIDNINKTVEVKLLQEMPQTMAKNLSEHDIKSLTSNDSFSDLVSVNKSTLDSNSPHSSDTIHSEAGSEDWENADFYELTADDPNEKCGNDSPQQHLNAKSKCKNDDDIKDWVQYQ